MKPHPIVIQERLVVGEPRYTVRDDSLPCSARSVALCMHRASAERVARALVCCGPFAAALSAARDALPTTVDGAMIAARCDAALALVSAPLTVVRDGDPRAVLHRAAPAMAEALGRVVAWAERARISDCPDAREVVEAARAALAQSKGD